MKRCSKCKIEKPFSQFNKNKSKKDGFSTECKSCIKSYNEKYYDTNKDILLNNMQNYRELNKDKTSVRNREYYLENKDKILIQVQEYYQENKDSCLLRMKKYSKNNPAKINAYKSKYRAAKLQATPTWLTDEDFQQIEKFYQQAHYLQLINEEEHHVDHIVPLQGKNVCGLHVPWNLQVITAKENLSKSNKYEDVT